MTTLSDQQLAAEASEACRENRPGDVARCLGELYVRGVFRRVAIRAYVNRGCPSAASAEDLENDLLVHLQTRICSFDATRIPFGSWLYFVAKNLLIEQLRRSNRYRGIPGESDDSGPSTGGDSVPETANKSERMTLLEEPFSDRDWQTLCEWAEKNVAEPVLIAVAFKFYGKLASETCPDRRQEWHRWFAECGFDQPADLFDYLNEQTEPGDIVERIKILANWSAVSAGTMQQQWHRKQHLAVQLTVFWAVWLPADCKFAPQQVQAALNHDTQERVPILCIDRLWHRSRSLDEWKQFEADFRFRGIAPLLRFLREPDLDVRLKLFAQSIYGDTDENLVALAALLDRNRELRNTLQA